MKKIRLTLLILLAVAAVPTLARAQTQEDVVRLHNGSVIRGTVTEMVPDGSLKIETRDGNLFVFRMDEVASMSRERPASYTRDRRAKTTYPAPSKFNKPRGYLGLVEVGAGSWTRNEDFSRSVTMVNGYRFFPQLALGVGTGFESWGDGDVAMPLFLHLRSDFIKNKVSPFVAMNFGGYVPLDSYYEGAMFEFQGGVSFNVGRRFRMTVGASLAMCEYYGYEGYYGYYESSSYDYNSDVALKIKVGFSF